MMLEIRNVTVGGSLVSGGQLRISAGDPPELLLLLDGDEFRASGFDLFDCLTELRLLLEGSGRLIGVQGAALDVYPSGMSRQTAGGRAAYRHGSPADGLELVDIFADSPLALIGSVAEQLSWIREHRARGRS